MWTGAWTSGCGLASSPLSTERQREREWERKKKGGERRDVLRAKANTLEIKSKAG